MIFFRTLGLGAKNHPARNNGHMCRDSQEVFPEVNGSSREKDSEKFQEAKG